MVDIGEAGTASAPDSATKKDEGKAVLIGVFEAVTHKGKETLKAPPRREQYINVDADVDPDTPHPEYGRLVRLKAQVMWDAGDMKRPLDGKEVHFYVTPGKDNKKGLTGNDKESFESLGSGKDKTTAKTDKDGWTPVVEFYPSQYGGDTFEVFAAMEADHKDAKTAGTFVVWRRFWYQVTEMKDEKGGKFDFPGAVSTAFELGYRSVFINVSEVGPRGQATHVGDLLDASARNAEAIKYFTPDQHAPFKCHLMTIDYSGTPTEEKNLVDEIKGGSSWMSPHYYWLWKHGGTHPWKLNAELSDDGGKSWKAIPDDALITAANATYPGLKSITIDFAKASVKPTPKAPVMIMLRIKIAGPSATLGWGGGSHHIYLCTGTLRDIIPRPEHVPMQRSDAVHELGHALGLVNKPPAPAGAHDAWEDKANPKHCKEPPEKCAMWYESSTKRITTFHGKDDGCHDYLRKQEFSRSVMKNRWKD
jgi:hypothetical protein